MAEQAWPGTARWFTHPLWRALKDVPMSRNDIEAGLLRLDSTVVLLLYKLEEPEHHQVTKQVEIDSQVIEKLINLGSIDALAATVLLARQAEVIASPNLRDMAVAAYRSLQPKIASLPLTSPFYGEIFDFADRRCKDWLYVSPNQRIDIHFFWQGLRDNVWDCSDPEDHEETAKSLNEDMAKDQGTDENKK